MVHAPNHHGNLSKSALKAVAAAEAGECFIRVPTSVLREAAILERWRQNQTAQRFFVLNGKGIRQLRLRHRAARTRNYPASRRLQLFLKQINSIKTAYGEPTVGVFTALRSFVVMTSAATQRAILIVG